MTRPSLARRGAVVGCLMLSLATAGCDGEAREFARRTALLLKERSARLGEKIRAELEASGKIATIALASERTVAARTLINERNHRSIDLAADYAEGRRPVSKWQSDILDYAQVDYTTNRDQLTAGFDASSRFMKDVQALELQKAKVDAVAKLLDSLQKPPTLKEELTALKDFGEDVKKALDERCAALKKAGDPVALATMANLKCPK